MDDLEHETDHTNAGEICENSRAESLIDRARTGDVDAFTELYLATAGWLLSRIRRLVGNAAAEDVLADVYIQVWNSLESFDQRRGPPAVWLAMIARSRALDHLRREKRLSAAHESGCQLGAFSVAFVETPEQILSRAELSRLLQVGLVEALSADERLVLGLAYFRESTHDEIALWTGMPLGTVKRLIKRAQQKLRAQLCPVGNGKPAASRGVSQLSP